MNNKEVYLKLSRNENQELVVVDYNGLSSVNVIIDDGVNIIEECVFSRYISFNYITLPNTLKEIREYAFWASSLVEIDIPDSVTSIKCGAFKECDKLVNVRLSKNLTLIEKATFEKCIFLKEIIIPEGVRMIESLAFCGCSNLDKIVLPETLEYIGAHAFSECERLEYIKVPKNVKVLGSGAFCNCTNLKKIQISTNTIIKPYAIPKCVIIEKY